MQNDGVTKVVQILKIDAHKSCPLEDVVIAEYSLGLFVNQKRLVNLLCSPMDLEELVLGYLLGEGIIRGLEDVKSIVVDKEGQKAFVTLACGDVFTMQSGETEGVRTLTTACGKQHSVTYALVNDMGLTALPDGFSISAEGVSRCMERFNKQSPLFIATGGVHSCGLYCGGEEVCFYEDIGRHNAFDKCMGYALEKGVELSQCMVATSGRVPSDFAIKAIKCALPLIVSRSAPTDKAITIAQEHNLTVIGFARGNRMNVYSALKRILV